MMPKKPTERIKPKERHISLSSGYIVSSKSHNIWIPASVCHGVVLHKEGHPGVVVAHRGSLTYGAPSGFSSKDVYRLTQGSPIMVSGRLKNAGDMINLMITAGLMYRKSPKDMKLTVIFPKAADAKTTNALHMAAESYKRLGLLAKVEFKSVRNDEVAMVRAKDGTVHIKPINEVVLSKSWRRHNQEWEE